MIDKFVRKKLHVQKGESSDELLVIPDYRKFNDHKHYDDNIDCNWKAAINEEHKTKMPDLKKAQTLANLVFEPRQMRHQQNKYQAL